MTNKKTILALLIIIPQLLSAYIDLGTYGNTHDIKESSFKVQLQEQYKTNFEKEKIENEIKKAYEKSFIIDGTLKECNLTQQREFIPEITISENIIMPYTNEILYKKGEKYNILTKNNLNFSKYIIFINANDDVQVNLAKTYKEYADILVVNGDIKKLLKMGINALIARDKIEVKMLDVKCFPSIYTQQVDRFLINEYNPKDLTKKE